MARAIRLASRGLYSTDPNPRVGCVILRDGEIVGEGWHERAGGPHAEVLALAAAGSRARGATAVVTLEPCSHHGRTPPCAEALLAAGVARVVAATVDPNPAVSGRGLEQLRDAGVEVEVGLLANEAGALNPGFMKRMRSGRPYVRMKLAMTLDGRTALAAGESRWITGPAARADVQRLRGRASAILTGVNTVLADDPSLDVRASECAVNGVIRQPLRVIADSTGRTPAAARTLGLPGSVLIATRATGAEALRQSGVDAPLEVCAERGGRVDLADLLDRLGRRGINELHVEAGATLAGALLADRLADEIVLYVAPALLGSGARGLVDLEVAKMSDRVELRTIDSRSVGDDWRITLMPVYSPRS
ncbi:MAG: bifunctional diaminohydroxyphosphoribosylaminopyrimidine deaminase/5-amino-6-(5-phosphoribosylamino)uracil reductase RibD [Chromatiales bacterium]|nr:bifunctional diaminohydroxyphosphoribosylaminopyrimidine deaminase/5-amino-6-(5-phosphoribosylamino)uracil reductase RibD [Chromatiales bacterium]